MDTTILVGDCLKRLKELPDESVHCVITSPPYWGLRDYGTAKWVGGNSGCEHVGTPVQTGGHTEKQVTNRGSLSGTKGDCIKCGAKREDSGIGLEPTLEEHISNLVLVFREVRRVLRPDGTLWLNYGDAHFSTPGKYYSSSTLEGGIPHSVERRKKVAKGLKSKDLMMMPERIAMALQADGWWLRQKIPWLKRNPMPESTEDRPTSSLEFVYLLAKSGNPLFWAHPEMRGVRTKPDPDYVYVNKEERIETDQAPDGWKEDDGWKRKNLWRGRDYFYDVQAIRTLLKDSTIERNRYGFDNSATAWGSSQGHHGANPKEKRRPDKQRGHARRHAGFNDRWDAMSKNEQQAKGRSFRNTDLMFESIREPWGLISDADGYPLAIDVTAKGFKGAHFATFPVNLVQPFIKAGTSEKGVCVECGAPWVRVVERSTDETSRTRNRREVGRESTKGEFPQNIRLETTGWLPTCEHDSGPVSATVLDPFAGAGTVGLVAQRLGRSSILIEISDEYALMARDRIAQDMPLFSQVKMEET